MRVEVGVKESSKQDLVRITWAGHVEKMAMRTDTQKVEGKWRRGRPKLRLGIALKMT